MEIVLILGGIVLGVFAFGCFFCVSLGILSGIVISKRMYSDDLEMGHRIQSLE